MKSCRNFSQQTTRSTPLDPNLIFCCISSYLVAFGIVCCVTTLSSKRAKLVQKFVPRSRVGIFRNKRTRSTRLDPYLMFRCVSYYLGAFGIVCCVTTLSSKRAKLVQKFVLRSRVGIFRSERTRSTPLDSKLMFWINFVQFGCILDRLVAFQNSVQNEPNWCKRSCHEVAS